MTWWGETFIYFKICGSNSWRVVVHHWHGCVCELVTPLKYVLETVPSTAPKSCCSHRDSWTWERGENTGAMPFAPWKEQMVSAPEGRCV